MLTLTHLFGFVAFKRNVKAVMPARPIVQAEEADPLVDWSPEEKAKRQRHISANRQLAEHLGLANITRGTPNRADW